MSVMTTRTLSPKIIGNTTGRVSYEEFLDWADENTHAEWINGEVIVFKPTKNVHQNVVEFLHVIMNYFVRLLGLGKVRLAPFPMRLENSGREPDILYIAKVLEGFWLRLSWLWRTEEIDPYAAFYEIRGLSAEQAGQIQELLRGGAEAAE